jgi:cardiolipin synthase (CMP-forming)
MNIPNLLSLSRIFLIPVFLYLLFLPDVWSKVAALFVFVVASITDILDGWSARTLKQESELGKFLDPLADKFLVIATLISFVIIDPLISTWMILVIVGRDLLITVMRYAGIRKGMALRTSRFGKIKTGFQMVSIIIIIMVFIVKSFGIDMNQYRLPDDHVIRLTTAIDLTLSMNNDNPYKWLIIGPFWLMMVVTVLTALSGLRYLMYNWRLLIPPYHPKAAR